jgi:hypothetical protein
LPIEQRLFFLSSMVLGPLLAELFYADILRCKTNSLVGVAHIIGLPLHLREALFQYCNPQPSGLDITALQIDYRALHGMYPAAEQP